MKKAYEAPKAEKMVFTYEESVVASNPICLAGISKKYSEQAGLIPVCESKFDGYVTGSEWHGEQA